MQYISPTDLKVSSEDGIYAVFFTANTPRDIPETLVVAAVTSGARPYVEGTTASEVEAVLDETAVNAVAEAMREIMGLDDPELLSASQIPRAAEINKRLDFKSTSEQRDAAWAMVEG
ncbi:MAG: hypothetical protein ACRBBW_20580 [Cellvibrionaceae bacterium]